ncbi:hypothetical protein AB6A23_11085 [Paenibacillus tarimensis]
MNEYPYKLYASVLLLDGKIESWKVVNYPKEAPSDFKAYWKLDRLKDYTAETKSWTVNNLEEHNDVFQRLAPEWFTQWRHADDYRGWHAYGEEEREF